jgi:hypothetical protein
MATKKSPASGTKTTTASPITRGIIITTIVAGILLVIANSALWVNNTVFNSDQFSDITTAALLTESSRTAIASEVVNQALASKPITRAVVGDTATRLIAGFIGSDQVRSTIDRMATRIHSYVTSKNPQNVEFELSGIKSTVGRIVGLAGNDAAGDKIDTLPDTLTIVDASKIPSFYQFAVVFLWLGPVALVGAIMLLVRPHYIRRRLNIRILAFQGAAIIITSMAAFLAGPLFRPPLLALISQPNYRTVVQNLYDALMSTFAQQTVWLLVVGIGTVIAATGIFVYSRRAVWLPKRRSV